MHTKAVADFFLLTVEISILHIDGSGSLISFLIDNVWMGMKFNSQSNHHDQMEMRVL